MLKARQCLRDACSGDFTGQMASSTFSESHRWEFMQRWDCIWIFICAWDGGAEAVEHTGLLTRKAPADHVLHKVGAVNFAFGELVVGPCPICRRVFVWIIVMPMSGIEPKEFVIYMNDRSVSDDWGINIWRKVTSCSFSGTGKCPWVGVQLKVEKQSSITKLIYPLN